MEVIYFAPCVSILCPFHLRSFQAILYPSPTIHGAVGVELIYVAACVWEVLTFSCRAEIFNL